ncbi:MAG TPA: hypothetical protein VGM62_12380 [Chthoniobacterales bacterium]
MKSVRRSLIVGVLLTLGASAFAGTASQTSTPTIKRAKFCYAIVGSAVPQPCDRFAGAIATTHFPLDVLGRKPR